MDEIIKVKEAKKTFKAKIVEKNILKNIFSPQYKTVKAVDNISFTMKKGEIVGFIGPNGAGKSTTIKMLTGILHPSGGEITVLGHTPKKNREQLAFHIGTIFGQRQQLWYHLPPIDSFMLFQTIYEVDKGEFKKRLNRLIELFGIEPFLNTPVRKLSLGQRMRCEFIASLLHNPKILFLDEPTIGLDVIAKKNIRELIKKLNKEEGTTIILTSHDLEDIEELCKRVIIINKGKILFDGKRKELKKKLKHKIVKIYFEKKTNNIPTFKAVKVLKRHPFKVTLEVNIKKIPIKKVLNAYLEKTNVADVIIEDVPIEKVIERLYT